MSTMANVVLSDATPTNHTFVPIAPLPIALYEDRTTPDTALGTAQLTMSVKRALSPNEVNKSQLKLIVPVEVTSTDTGVVTVQGHWQFVGEFMTPSSSTSTDRGHLLAMVRDLIDEAIVTEVVKDQIPPS